MEADLLEFFNKNMEEIDIDPEKKYIQVIGYYLSREQIGPLSIQLNI